MAWWDHEELKSPEDRSDRYKKAFPEEYKTEEKPMNEQKYALQESLIDTEFFAYHLFDYETGGGMMEVAPGVQDNWHGSHFPEQIKDFYRSKALSILRWLDENGRPR